MFSLEYKDSGEMCLLCFEADMSPVDYGPGCRACGPGFVINTGIITKHGFGLALIE